MNHPTNNPLRDDILYYSPVDKPITELRHYGDKLALYTEDKTVFHRFSLWKQLLYLNPYSKEGKMTGGDLFFPKSATKELLRTLNDIQPGACEKHRSTTQGNNHQIEIEGH